VGDSNSPFPPLLPAPGCSGVSSPLVGFGYLPAPSVSVLEAIPSDCLRPDCGRLSKDKSTEMIALTRLSEWLGAPPAGRQRNEAERPQSTFTNVDSDDSVV